MNARARLLAFYLPQFHPIPENDAWWGAGFTEWTNVVKARPLFRGHYQPHLPADLGFYDLRVPEVREAQAELARQAGIEAFAYYHYWFGGRRVLERPFTEVVAFGQPDFPFCLCWANHTWAGVWYGAPSRVLIEQTYPGEKDHERHFMALLDAFLDRRYVRIDDRPVFVIFRPMDIPEVRRFTDRWRDLATKNGLAGMHFVAHLFPTETGWGYRAHGFDGVLFANNVKAFSLKAVEIARRRMAVGGDGQAARFLPIAKGVLTVADRALQRLRRGFQNVLMYEDAMLFFLDACDDSWQTYPCVIPNWDNTPRSGEGGFVLHDSRPDLFEVHLRQAVSMVGNRPPEYRLVFIKSWNEWAEGNYLEPDHRFGREYLNAVRRVLLDEASGHLEYHSEAIRR